MDEEYTIRVVIDWFLKIGARKLPTNHVIVDIIEIGAGLARVLCFLIAMKMEIVGYVAMDFWVPIYIWQNKKKYCY